MKPPALAPSVRTVRHLVSLLLLLVCLTGVASAQGLDETLHVAVGDPAASDENPGTRAQPLETIQEAVDRALANKRDFQSTRVLVHPGTYRESIQVWDGSDQGNSVSIVIEAQQPGTVVISGSKVLAGWQRAGGVWVHSWPYEISSGSNLLKRREIVVVNGDMLTQVMSKSALGPGSPILDRRGSFYVNNQANKLFVKPAPEVDMNRALVEAGVREVLWDQRREDHITIRGITFEHATTEWTGGQAAVRVLSSKHTTFERCTFHWNNWQGIWIGYSEHITLRHSSMNHNGGQGWGAWHVKDLRAFYTETSYNNWRGMMAGHTGWNVGNKLLAVHGLVIKHHVARGNWSRGLWLDYDVADALLVDLVVEDNLLDGIWFEASQGPITLKNSVIRGNGRSGLRTTFTQNVTLVGNVFARNAEGQEVIQDDSQFIIDGSKRRRDVENFETGEMMYLSPRNWTIINNTFIGGEFHHQYAAGPTLIDTDLSGEAWQEFIRTLEADNNTYYHPNRQAVFGFPHQEDLTLQQWQARTGEDQRSVFGNPGNIIDDIIDDIDSNDDSESNQRPQVVLDSPTSGAVFAVGETATIVASASDPNGAVARVTFLVNGEPISNDATNTFSASWAPQAPGTYELAARAVDEGGLITTSSPVTVTVSQPQDGAGDENGADRPGDQDRFAGQVIEVTNQNFPLYFGDRIGTRRSADVQFDPSDAGAAALIVTGYDINSLQEVAMFVNGEEVALPAEIVGDGVSKTVTVPVDLSVLNNGTNTIAFETTQLVEGAHTNFRYRIEELTVELLAGDIQERDDQPSDGDSDDQRPSTDDSFGDRHVSQTIEVTDNSFPLYFGSRIGTHRSADVQLDPSDADAAALVVTGYDINSLQEVTMYVNGEEVSLPAEIIGDGVSKTATVPVDLSVLKHGANTIAFEITKLVDGAHNHFRYRIGGLKVVFLEGSDQSAEANDTGKQPLKRQVVDIDDKNLPLYFGSRIGTRRSASVTLNPSRAESAAVTITAYDINSLQEAAMYVNGEEVSLSTEIIGNGVSKTATMLVDVSVLREGANEITFEVTKLVDGAQNNFRYRVDELSVVLMRREAGKAGGQDEQLSGKVLPETFRLRGNYPNPFNPATTILFDLPARAQVSLQVFDMLGRQVMQLSPRTMAAGAGRQIRLEASRLASGIYLYRLIAEMEARTLVRTGRMTFVK